VKRDSGSPSAAGNSHAIALTSAICSGGKTARATRARSILESFQALFEETSSPAANDAGRGVETGGDLDVASAFGRIEHDPRSLHLSPLALLSPGHSLELPALLAAELNPVAGGARHRTLIPRGHPDSFTDSGQYLRTALLGRSAA